jgi:hypothetical protein
MIYSISKNSGMKIDYKNTYKRIKRLASLEFIEPVKAEDVNEKDARHGAKYYRISETGIFQVFLRIDILFDLFDLLQINGSYSIFEALLYPHFERETFKSLNRKSVTTHNWTDSFVEKWIIIDIYNYLRNCCVEINGIIKFINENRNGPQYLESVKGRRYIEVYSDRMKVFRDNLALNILGLFSNKDKEWQDTLTILAQDNKFMKVVDKLHDDFERCFAIAMQLGDRA